MSTIREYIKMIGMTVVFTLGQALAFWVVLPLWGGAYEMEKQYEKIIS